MMAWAIRLGKQLPRICKCSVVHPLLLLVLLAAAVLARALRRMRLAFGLMPRIARGPRAMVGLAYNARADRAYGYKSDVVVRNLGEWGYQYVYRDEFDVVIEWSPKFLLIQRVAGFIRIMFGYDILVTFFNGSFFRSGLLSRAELVILKLAGVRIIAVCYGSDVIQFDFPPPRFDWINHLLKD